MKAILPLLLFVVLCTGCTSNVSARRHPDLDIGRFRYIFVERRLNENRHINEMLVEEIRRLGLEAETGPLTMLPDKADAVLRYNARWTWDFRTYLVELDMELHTARTEKKLADARYYQPTMRPKAPEQVVRELVARMFAPARAPASTTK